MNVELLKQLGNIGQIAGIRESRLLRGRGEGIAAYATVLIEK